MEFIFQEPLDKAIGRSISLDIDESLPLSTLIEKIGTSLSKLNPNGFSLTDEKLFAHVLFFRSGQLVKLDEIVSADDTIEVLMMATGG